MGTWSFIRHGESLANAEGWFAGQADTPLTELGIDQARRMRALVAEAKPKRAFASDLSRARRTAEIVLEGIEIPLAIVPELRERSCGDWEGRAITDIDACGEMEIFLRWDTRPPGGESLLEVARRAIGWLSTVDDDTDTLVVAHGALIRSVIGVVDQRPWPEIGQWKPRNCELVARSLPQGTWARLLGQL